MNHMETGERRNRIMAEMQQVYQEDVLPSRLSQDYQILSCLKYTETKRVYLLEEIKSSQRCILKWGSGREGERLQKEFATLTSMEAAFLPKVFSCFIEEGVTYLLREYIAGETLEQRIDRAGVYSPAQAITVMLDICCCVRMMHTHIPPFVHRDIKPQNILVTADGNYKFIDMDTVREYKEDGSCDTVCLGTRETAAPEQFGYQQSSVRSDIYSLGILFLYLLTGCYSTACSEWKVLPAPIRKTIRKCLAFDPESRYASVMALYRELKSLKRFSKCRQTVALQASISLLLIVAAALMLVHRMTVHRYYNQSVSFQNPQIEAAVRETLGFDENTPITQADLEGVTTLILCGDRTFQSWEEHEEYHGTYFSEFDNEVKVMTPAELSDLQYLPNLHTVVLDNQGIESLSVLQGLSLRRLSLEKNNIMSLEGIEENSKLTSLDIRKNPISDIEALAAITGLQQLDISETTVGSMDVLKDLPLTSLKCSDTNITDYSPLVSMNKLTCLQVSGVDSETIAQINTLTNLKILGLFESDLTSLEELSDMKGLECIDITFCYRMNSLSGVDNFPKLNYLGIASTEITDISSVAAISQLHMLDITDAPIDDLTPIEECGRLRMVFIDSRKEAGIQQLHMRETVEIIVNQ